MYRIERRPAQRISRAFSLVELLTVMAITSILVSTLLPALGAAREAARRTKCRINLRQIGLAVENYRSANGAYPPGQYRKKPGTDRYAWSEIILPFLEQSSIYEAIDIKRPMVNAVNKGTSDSPGPLAQVIEVYLCPSTGRTHETRHHGRIISGSGAIFDTVIEDQADGFGVIDFLGVSGAYKKAPYLDGSYGKDTGVLISVDKIDITIEAPIRIYVIPDGASKTILVIECTGRGWEKGSRGVWADGRSIGSIGRVRFDESGEKIIHTARINMDAPTAWTDEEPYSEHPGGVNTLMCDGSVQFLSEDMAASVLRAMATRRSMEPLPNGIFD